MDIMSAPRTGFLAKFQARLHDKVRNFRSVDPAVSLLPLPSQTPWEDLCECEGSRHLSLFISGSAIPS